MQLKPRPPSIQLSQKSTTMIARPPVDWGSDEYEDPACAHSHHITSRGGSQQSAGEYYHTISPTSPQYADMYQDPDLHNSTRPPLPTLPVSADQEGNQAQNLEYCAMYQDPAKKMGAPPVQSPSTPIYSDTYQDPAVGSSMTLPPGQGSDSPTDEYSEAYQDPALTAHSLPPNMDLRPTYEVPGEGENGASSNRQYSVLKKQESDDSVY